MRCPISSRKTGITATTQRRGVILVAWKTENYAEVLTADCKNVHYIPLMKNGIYPPLELWLAF